MSVNRIVPNLETTEIAASTAFYVDLLGLDVVMDQGWIATLAGSKDSRPQISLITRDRTAPVVANLSVEVDDVDAVHAKAIARGHEIVHPLTDEPWGVRRFFVKDPDGKVVNVLQHS